MFILNELDLVSADLKEAQKPSDIEMLSFKIKQHKDEAKSKITEARKLIESSKIDILYNKCYKDQVGRLINGQSYTLDYCNDLDVLESYKVKK